MKEGVLKNTAAENETGPAVTEDPREGLAGVAEVWLEDFRNYASLHVCLDPGFNILCGRNAQGKTNFLEALYLLATTRLLRGQRDAEAIRDGAGRATVSAETRLGRTRVSITLERGIRKRGSLNGMSLPRASDLIGRLPCVSVSAADLEIVRGDPADRRMFLDVELSGLYPAYLRHFTLYKRALEQRNALLREHRENPVPAALYEPWEAQMAEHGISLRMARRSFVEGLAASVRDIHGRMGSGEAFCVEYAARDKADTAEDLAAAMARSREADSARGGTGSGPHRDDLNLEVDGREARLYGSQGQQRTAVIALKLATLVHARAVRGQAPVLLLDDILSDLDERRRALLVDVVLEASGQAVLTCTEVAAAGERIVERARVFEVSAGNVRRL